MLPEQPMRSYNRTSFKLFALAFLATIIMDYAGVSLHDVTNYADGILKKTHENISLLAIWAWPIITIIREQVDDWRKSMHARDIEIERLRAGK